MPVVAAATAAAAAPAAAAEPEEGASRAECCWIQASVTTGLEDIAAAEVQAWLDTSGRERAVAAAVVVREGHILFPVEPRNVPRLAELQCIEHFWALAADTAGAGSEPSSTAEAGPAPALTGMANTEGAAADLATLAALARGGGDERWATALAAWALVHPQCARRLAAGGDEGWARPATAEGEPAPEPEPLLAFKLHCKRAGSATGRRGPEHGSRSHGRLCHPRCSVETPFKVNARAAHAVD